MAIVLADAVFLAVTRRRVLARPSQPHVTIEACLSPALAQRVGEPEWRDSQVEALGHMRWVCRLGRLPSYLCLRLTRPGFGGGLSLALWNPPLADSIWNQLQ